MVYWSVWTKQELAARQEQLAKEEKEKAALDMITADKVICGEQQPESDHFVEMEGARTGDDEGIHWRDADGWFSYKMKSGGKSVDKVRILFNSFGKRDAKVYINGAEAGSFACAGAPSKLVCELAIPASEINKEELVIKIGKGEQKFTPRVYEIRLIKK